MSHMHYFPKRLSIFLLATSALLHGCSNSPSVSGGNTAQEPNVTTPDASTEPDPRTLCITTDCGSREVLVRAPEAENLRFTPDGRLFVSGVNLFEIIKHENGNFEAVVVPMDGPHSPSLGGLATANGILYLNDEGENGLWAGRLDDPNMQMQKIHTWNTDSTPNGLDFGPDGALYSTHGPQPDTVGGRSVLRAQLDPDDPFNVLRVEPVFTIDDLLAANGLVRKQNTFYVVAYGEGVDNSSVAAFDVTEAGEVGPRRRIVGSPNGTFDDLEVIGDRVLVANIFMNSLLMFDLEGNQLADSGPIFEGPTALTFGRPPMFEPTDLIITERGVLGEPDSDFGNKLSVFRPHSVP